MKNYRPSGAHKHGVPSGLDNQSPDKKIPIKNGYVKSFDGTQLFYSVEGEGPPLIFCYGIVCSSLHWTYQIEYFRRRYSTVWLDYRGHHRSATPRNLDTLNCESVGTDVTIIMDELGLKEAVLLGHSMGVNVVLEVFRQTPKRVKALVLANGTSRRPLENLFHTNATQTGLKMMRYAFEAFPEVVRKLWREQKRSPFSHALLKYGGFNPSLTPDSDVKEYLEKMSDIDPEVFITFMENYDKLDQTNWLDEVSAPTLIISGEKDLITPPPEQELLHQLIPGSQLEVIPGGSHCSQMDMPELISLKIEKFLKKLKY